MGFKITLLDNAVDEINSIRCDLNLYLDIVHCEDIPVNEQYYAVKRTIKQIICAWELLMKYRLQKEDWTLIFTDPNQATVAALKSGDFKSVGYKKAIKRLGERGVVMTFSNLKELHQFRNQIEHYQIDASLTEILSTIAAAIDELTFFFEQYIEDIADEKTSVSRGMSMLWELQELRRTLSNLLSEGFFTE